MWISVTLLFSMIATGFASTVDDCPAALVANERAYLKVEDNICYRFVIHKRRTYEDARKDCFKYDGGHLVMPRNNSINTFLVTALRDYDVKDRVWIGINDIEIEGEFKWCDGTFLREHLYSSWSDDDGPSHHGLFSAMIFKDCAVLDPRNYKWYTKVCDNTLFSNHEKPYICQYKM